MADTPGEDFLIEAIWSIGLVRGSSSSYAGVLCFSGGKVFGGDADYFYVGNYALNRGRVYLRFTVHPYGDKNPVDPPSKCKSPFDVELAGQIESTQMVLVGTIIEDPTQSVTAVAKRLHEIPAMRAPDGLSKTR